MSVDCTITMPPGTRVRDAAHVIGRLLDSVTYNDGNYIDMPNVSVTPYEMPSLAENCRIRVTSYGLYGWEAMWSFETDRGAPGSPGLVTRSTPLNIAIARGLVDFFGGEVDYNDCDITTNDYTMPVRTPIAPTDGGEWVALQQAVVDVRPLTEADISVARQWAAYSD